MCAAPFPPQQPTVRGCASMPCCSLPPGVCVCVYVPLCRCTPVWGITGMHTIHAFYVYKRSHFCPSRDCRFLFVFFPCSFLLFFFIHLRRIPSFPPAVLSSHLPFSPSLSLSSPPAPPSGTAEGGCAVTACRAPVRLTARSRWPLAYLPLRRPRPSFRRHPAGCPSRLRRGCGKRRTRRRRRRRRRAC